MRKFQVYSYTWAKSPHKHRVGKTSTFVISDTTDDSLIEVRTIAEFPVTEAFPEEEQLALANIMCDFLNKRLESIQKTFDDDKLLQRIIL